MEWTVEEGTRIEGQKEKPDVLTGIIDMTMEGLQRNEWISIKYTNQIVREENWNAEERMYWRCMYWQYFLLFGYEESLHN